MTFEARFDLTDVDWTHMEGGPEFDYPIEFDVAVLGSQADLGTLDLLVRFAPHSHCHFHRHVAATRTLVLQGEHHVFDVGSNGETVHKIKPAGTYSQSPAGEIHMERGGPDGAIVLFNLHSPTGVLFETLDPDHNVLAQSTIESMSDGPLMGG